MMLFVISKMAGVKNNARMVDSAVLSIGKNMNSSVDRTTDDAAAFVQDLMTAMIYAHVLNRGPSGILSPVDERQEVPYADQLNMSS